MALLVSASTWLQGASGGACLLPCCLLRAPLPHAEVEGIVPAIPDVLQVVLSRQLRDIAVDRPAIRGKGGSHIVVIGVIIDFDEANLCRVQEADEADLIVPVPHVGFVVALEAGVATRLPSHAVDIDVQIDLILTPLWI